MIARLTLLWEMVIPNSNSLKIISFFAVTVNGNADNGGAEDSEQNKYVLRSNVPFFYFLINDDMTILGLVSINVRKLGILEKLNQCDALLQLNMISPCC